MLYYLEHYYFGVDIEQVPVDEIVLKIYDAPSYKYCETIGYDSLGIGSANGDKYGCIKIIPKEEITPEILDENCEIWDWECLDNKSNSCDGYDKDTNILEYKCKSDSMDTYIVKKNSQLIE